MPGQTAVQTQAKLPGRGQGGAAVNVALPRRCAPGRRGAARCSAGARRRPRRAETSLAAGPGQTRSDQIASDQKGSLIPKKLPALGWKRCTSGCGREGAGRQGEGVRGVHGAGEPRRPPNCDPAACRTAILRISRPESNSQAYRSQVSPRSAGPAAAAPGPGPPGSGQSPHSRPPGRLKSDCASVGGVHAFM